MYIKMCYIKWLLLIFGNIFKHFDVTLYLLGVDAAS